MKRIAILGSGSGSNAQAIIDYFDSRHIAKVELILSNKKDAFILKRAERAGIKNLHFNRQAFYEEYKVLDLLRDHQIDLIVLAGFLWLIPEQLIQAFFGSIINIHPSILPHFGGKGMYGIRVHQAAIEARTYFSGITIHQVNAQYDEGQLLFQRALLINTDESAEELAARILQLEHRYFPKVIEGLLTVGE